MLTDAPRRELGFHVEAEKDKEPLLMKE